MDQGVGARPPPGEIWVSEEIHRPNQDLEKGVEGGQEEAAEGDDGLLPAYAGGWF